MSTDTKPLIGVPFRSLKEEDDPTKRAKIEPYLRAVEAAGGSPREISLHLPPDKLTGWAAAFDAFLLTGSPADVDPSWYHAERRAACGESDPHREQADFALLDCAFSARKPVLAICYGVQSLNVFLGGSLLQDIPSEKPDALQHEWKDKESDAPEPHHDVLIESNSRLAQLVGETRVRVNSSHHQALDRLGRDLRVAARAPDGIIEAVEYTADGPWVFGVQWHPESMTSDALAQSLFRELIAAAKKQVVGSR